MNHITITLTEDQLGLIMGIMDGAIYQDTNDQTRAFKIRVQDKLSKSIPKTV